MNILISSLVDLKKTSHGRLHEFIKYLLSRGHDITIISVNTWWLKDLYSNLYYNNYFEEMLQKANIIYLTKRKINPIIQEIFFLRTLSKLVDYDLFDLHINYHSLITGYLIAKKMRELNVPTVCDIADDLSAAMRITPQIPRLIRPLAGFVTERMMRRNIQIADKVTFTLDTLRDTYNIPKSKSELIPNGVDIQLFRNCPSEQLREELSINQDFVIGYVGVLREWVDLEPVFFALNDLDMPIKLLIVGEEGGFEENKNLVKRYGISDKVIFTGTVPYTQVPRYISCMDTCLIPFKINAVSENALPMKLFEYMACEKAVISTKLLGVVEVARNGVLYASNKEEFKDKITKLYKDENLRREMGQEGRKFVEESYSWSNIASKFESVLLEVANRNG